MGKALTSITAVIALVGLAPWAIFLGGLAKLTDQTLGWDIDNWTQQAIFMLEWYILSFQFLCLIAAAVAGVFGGYYRSHSMLCNWFAVNTILLIYRATLRINQINLIKDNGSPEDQDSLPQLRAIAAGQVSCSAFNFFLAILMSLAGTADDVLPPKPEHQGEPVPANAA